MNDSYQVGGLRFRLGEYSSEINKAIQRANQDQLVKRIWEQDHTTWKPDPDEITNRLGWLDIASRMRDEIAPVTKFVEGVKADGIDRVLLLGMGGSSLAPELFSDMLKGSDGLQLSVLDSTDPNAVLEAEKSHEPSHTLYIVSSKSGGTIETISFFKFFYNVALEAVGAPEVGNHFISITDPGSGLAEIAKQYSFREIFYADPNIGGRYSALSHFGLVPAALVGVDLERLLDSANEMADACKNEQINQNPGALLGIVLGTLAKLGRDKATFVLPKQNEPFGNWVEQLIAESTGKEGKGILPVIGEKLVNTYPRTDRVFIGIGAHDVSPFIGIEWFDNYTVGTQFFLWEYATAVAGYILGINPFDQPNVESAKARARETVNEYTKSGKLPSTHSEASKWSDIENQKIAYIAFQVYAAPSGMINDGVKKLRSEVTNRLGIATTFGYGPRFLHSTGQLHKGDSGKGLFIQIVSEGEADAPIPDIAGEKASQLSFGVLKRAQALGDAQALHEAGRKVWTIDTNNVVDAIESLKKELTN